MELAEDEDEEMAWSGADATAKVMSISFSHRQRYSSSTLFSQTSAPQDSAQSLNQDIVLMFASKLERMHNTMQAQMEALQSWQ